MTFFKNIRYYFARYICRVFHERYREGVELPGWTWCNKCKTIR